MAKRRIGQLAAIMKSCIDSKLIAIFEWTKSAMAARKTSAIGVPDAHRTRPTRGRRARIVGAAILSLLAQSAGSSAAIADGRLPDGSYRCEAYLLGLFLDLGTITIKGNVYSGPAYGNRTGQGYNYQIDPNGELAWLGPLGGFTSGGNSISLTQVTADGEKDASFDIIMRQTDGAFTAATCTINPTVE